jgi:hypothetical protein
MKEYFLHIWGGAMPVLKELYNITENYYWFNSFEERQNFIDKISKHKGLGLAIDLKDGEFTHLRTIAEMDLIYQNKIYHFEYDFGYEYPEDAAEFMFFEGNYSCDCNLSLFIQRSCDPDFPELNCGEEIEIKNFKIKHIK